MDLRYTREDLDFREEVRAFLRAALPADIQGKVRKGQVLLKEDIVRWQRIMNERGWAVPAWPVEWGGTGWSLVRQYIFKEEMYAANAPEPFALNTVMVGPVIAAFGTRAQKEFFLPRIANLDFWFCQGFSEPGAGSDLASLRTRAVREGDRYVVHGQKLWTTWAHHADWMFCLVRTDPAAAKQSGISYLLIDMKTPGITVRPITTIDDCHHTNEVFLDGVSVPVANLIGEENRGWNYAKFLLGNERVLTARVGLCRTRLREAKAILQEQVSGELSLEEASSFRARIAAIEIELKALEITNLRLLHEAQTVSGPAQAARASILKIKGSELQQAIAELLLDLAGPHALPRQTDYLLGGAQEPVGPEWAATIAPRYLFGRAASIYGGTSEVQRNIIARAVLGL